MSHHQPAWEPQGSEGMLGNRRRGDSTCPGNTEKSKGGDSPTSLSTPGTGWETVTVYPGHSETQFLRTRNLISFPGLRMTRTSSQNHTLQLPPPPRSVRIAWPSSILNPSSSEIGNLGPAITVTVICPKCLVTKFTLN